MPHPLGQDMSKAKDYLNSFRAKVRENERVLRYRKKAWLDVLRELSIDRGVLLGSKQYDSLNGVEKAKALRAIDEHILLCYTTIEELTKQNNRQPTHKAGFKHRCQRIRNTIASLDEETLGSLEEL